MRKSIIAIPMGDPSGIGPEIILKAALDSVVQSNAICIVVGDRSVLEAAMEFCGFSLNINEIESPEQCIDQTDVLNLINLNNVDISTLKMGCVSGECGQAAFEYIQKAIDLAMQKKVDAVATTPINKESLRAGGINFIGHTEIFAELTGTRNPLTMFEVHGMRVFFLSRHVSLRDACDLVTKDRIVDCVKQCIEALDKLGVPEGTLAIAGLNPHSGEHGLFGSEEMTQIIPAVEELNSMGYSVVGPIGADSVFHLALEGRYCAVLSLYHDQGHIATKTLDFERTIAITNGLPFLRTSVDHGTAFDIAGKGIASPVSMVEAISISTCFNYSIPILEQIELVSEAGFSHLSLGMDYEHSGIFDGQRLAALKLKLAECNISIDTIHNGVNLDCQEWDEILLRTIEAAKILDVKVIVLHCSKFIFEVGEYEARHVAISKKIKKIEYLCRVNGVRAALENVTPGISTMLMTEILKISNPEYIGFCYDSSHDQLNGPRPMELLDKWKDRLLAIHISDRAGIIETHLLPGEGYIDFAEMTEILRTIPFSIPLLLEVDMKYSKYADVHWFLQQAYDAANELESSIRTNRCNE
jgi:4-hydroxythreonine-4-phosphate dehydrogenase